VFSARLPAELDVNRTTLARERVGSYLDLTESNPTRAGFAYPTGILAPLAGPDALRYEPHPCGLPAGREAVAADYRRRGVTVPADRIVLTASTSEAYSLLFKLLCDPGDEVLVPRPGYPLFDHLTRLDVVTPVPYDLAYEGAWRVNLDSLSRGLTDRTRAVLVVSPNNPTGSVATAEDLAAVDRICAPRGVAVIGDEVFADYRFDDGRPGPSVLDAPQALTFGLGGLSKSVGLPQVKLAWLAGGGPDAQVRSALERLAIIADAYLSVSTPVQVAAGHLLTAGAAVREQMIARVRANRRYLADAVARHPSSTLLHAEAGWSAVVQVPAMVDEEALVLELLERRGVLVHPGYFFDFPREAFLVVSLLVGAETFRAGVDRALGHVEEMIP